MKAEFKLNEFPETTCYLNYTLAETYPFYASYENGPSTNTVAAEPSTNATYSFQPYPCASGANGYSKLTYSFTDPVFEVKEVTFKAPTVTTKAASSITQTGATLNGEITPNGLTTEYHFEYGLEKEKYGTKVPVPDTSITSGPWTAQAKSKAVSELLPGTTYHFRLVAKNKEGTTNGSDQTFTTLVPPPVCDPLSKSRVKIGDMNGDSKADISTFTDPADKVGEGRVWISEGKTFKEKEKGEKIGTGFGVAFEDRTGDWDGDGDDDIFQFTEYGRVYGWLSEGTKYKALAEIGKDFGLSCESKIGDMNGDGKDDIFRFVNDGKGYVRLSTGSPTGYGEEKSIGTGFGLSNEVRVGDMDGDGDDDLFQFTNEGNGYAWRSDKTSYAFLGLIATGLGTSNEVRVGDMDGDGDDDLFQFTDDGRVYGWLSEGTKYKALSQIGKGFGLSRQMRVADMDGDGKVDIFQFNDDGKGYASFGKGTEFATAVQIGSGFGIP
jgi:hypothetical protein